MRWQNAFLLAATALAGHGVDADHNAAIDNVERKLMVEGKPSPQA